MLKRFISIISLINLFLLFCCKAAYAEEYIVRTVDKNNVNITGARNAIQFYLDEAKNFATDEKRYKIIVPAGEYNIDRNLNIYSNTWLYLEKGARINKCYTSGTMIKNGVSTSEYKGYAAFKNIKLEGGTWNGNCFSEVYGKDKAADFSNIRIGHATNVELKNVNIINNNMCKNLFFINYHSIGCLPCLIRYSLVNEKCLLPKNPR